MVSSEYHPSFFSHVGPGSAASARTIVPLLMDLPGVRSVVDVGCGSGEWLATFADLGIEDYLGLDGEYVDTRSLSIPPDRFVACDLEQAFRLDRRFDLVVSLEVAEHLGPEFSGRFVELLTHLAPVVAFSAAVPGQGGVGHVNEQWPDYWAALFATRGYTLVDRFRRRLWDEPSIEPWYRQNLFLYVADDQVGRYTEPGPEAGMPLRVVHPELFASKLAHPSLRSVVKSFPSAVALSLSARWARRPKWLGRS